MMHALAVHRCAPVHAWPRDHVMLIIAHAGTGGSMSLMSARHACLISGASLHLHFSTSGEHQTKYRPDEDVA